MLILTTFDLDEYAFGALRAGASGFLLKDVPPRVSWPPVSGPWPRAMRSCRPGSPAACSTSAPIFLNARHPMATVSHEAALAGLTDREREVLVAVADGLSNAEIGRRLFVSEATVKSHVGRILGKLGLRDRVQAVVYAFQTGIVRPERRS